MLWDTELSSDTEAAQIDNDSAKASQGIAPEVNETAHPERGS